MESVGGIDAVYIAATPAQLILIKLIIDMALLARVVIRPELVLTFV